jgi:flagellar biosynthesis protein FlhG
MFSTNVSIGETVAQPSEVGPRVFAVCSGKGGVGKTTVAANLASAWAQQGKRVLLVDADVGLSNVQLALALHPRFTMEHVVMGMVHARDALCAGPFGLKVLCGASGTSLQGVLDEAQKVRLLQALGELAAGFDVVVVDAQSGLGDSVLFFAGASDDTVLVVNPEPASIADAYVTIKLLEQGARARAFHVVVNRATSETQARQAFSRLTSVTSRFLGARVQYAGAILLDDRVHQANVTGQPLATRSPDAPANKAFGDLAKHFLSLPPSVSGGLRLMGSQPPQPATPTWHLA